MIKLILIFMFVFLSTVALSGTSETSLFTTTTTTVPRAFLPIVFLSESCPVASQNQYVAGTAFQFDLDNPVRLAVLHADKNLAMRSYAQNTDPGLLYDLVDYGNNAGVQPPQLATIFKPANVGVFTGLLQIHDWDWALSPDPGSRGSPQTSPPVTALVIDAKPGEKLHVPTSGHDIGGGMEVIVLFADEDTIALRYTREDSSGSGGYTLHIDNICTDPNLLALYNSLDDHQGPRYRYVPPRDRPYAYPLPALPAGQLIGTVRDGGIVVAISDVGAFQDPRSCNDWWQIRPNYGSDCAR